MAALRLLLICIVLCLGTVTIDGKCDDGWKHYERENKCLKWFGQLKSLKEANQECEGLGGDTKLFKIDDGLEAATFLKWTLLSGDDTKNSIWLDFANTTVKDVNENFIINNPYRMPHYNNKECSSVILSNGPIIYWHLRPCNSKYYGYICEQPEIDQLGEKVKIVLKYGKGMWKFEVPNFPHGTSSVEDSFPCPSGWNHTSDGDTNKCYRLYNDNTNFFTANQKCKKVTNGKGGLLKILSYDFYKVITTLMTSAKGYYRIGIQLRNGDFSFTDGPSSSLFKFVDWQNWFATDVGECFEFYYQQNFWQIRRTFCFDQYTNAYICQRSA